MSQLLIKKFEYGNRSPHFTFINSQAFIGGCMPHSTQKHIDSAISEINGKITKLH